MKNSKNPTEYPAYLDAENQKFKFLKYGAIAIAVIVGVVLLFNYFF